jgi:hypothetical protein
MGDDLELNQCRGDAERQQRRSSGAVAAVATPKT